MYIDLYKKFCFNALFSTHLFVFNRFVKRSTETTICHQLYVIILYLLVAVLFNKTFANA